MGMDGFGGFSTWLGVQREDKNLKQSEKDFLGAISAPGNTEDRLKY
jgi:hypothetical protein